MELEIIQILKTLSKPEIKQFREFISSPLFNKNTSIISYYKELIKSYPNFLNINPQGTEIYKRLYGNKNYNQSTLINLAFRLKTQLLNFLSVNNFRNNKHLSSEIIMDELLKRGLFGIFKNYYKRVNRNINRYEREGFFYNYKINTRHYNYFKLSTKVIKKRHALRDISLLNNSNLYLTFFYITELISNYLIFKANAVKYSLDTIGDFTEQLINILQSYNFNEIFNWKNDNDFLVNIYLALLKAYTNFNNEKYYYEYKDVLIKHRKSLTNSELNFHYTRLINYCTLKENEIESIDKFSLEQFELYTTFINKHIYKSSLYEFLPVSLYRAVILLAFRLNKIEYLLEFIKNETKNLNIKDRDNLYNFGMAYYYYIMEDLEKASKSINNIKLDFFIYKYDIKILELKICFDKNEIQACLSIINSYKELIKRDKLLSPERKSHHRNFILYVEKLIKKLDSKRADIEYYQNKLRNENKVLYKDWLLNRYEQVIKKLEEEKAQPDLPEGKETFKNAEFLYSKTSS